MQFGKVEFPELLDFTLPLDHNDTPRILSKYPKTTVPEVFIGCAKWNKQDLKNFYPKGTKDELTYYSRQFNCIELNASFYQNFSSQQYQTWYNKTPEGFKFFPKLSQNISHFKKLHVDTQPFVDDFLNNAQYLEEKLGTIFLQLHTNFSPEYFDRVVHFVEKWPQKFKLAIEFRHTDWFNDTTVATELCELLEKNNISNVLVDTAGRRDIIHMRMTNNEAFIRFVGTNNSSDYLRLDEWATRLKNWTTLGIKKIHFFVHQNNEIASPLLSKHFIQKINKELKLQIKKPRLKNDNETWTLF